MAIVIAIIITKQQASWRSLFSQFFGMSRNAPGHGMTSRRTTIKSPGTWSRAYSSSGRGWIPDKTISCEELCILRSLMYIPVRAISSTLLILRMEYVQLKAITLNTISKCIIHKLREIYSHVLANVWNVSLVMKFCAKNANDLKGMKVVLLEDKQK